MTRTAPIVAALLSTPLLAAAPATRAARGPEVATWVSGLIDRDVNVRERSRSELMGLTPSDLPLLRACVVSRPPRPGQAAALREVIVHVLTRQRLQALPTSGIQHIGVFHLPIDDPPHFGPGDEPLPDVGTVIGEVIPGSPAARWLQIGDVIVGLDEPGRPAEWLQNGDQLKQWVRSCPPGDAVTLVVRRAARVLRLTITPDARPLEPDGATLRESMVMAQNAQAEANREFDAAWAGLAGMTP